MDEEVPSVRALSDIYSSDLVRHGVRYQALTETFIRAFGARPDFIVRAPGRVNIIGEHIDYCDFPVFPMAIVPDFIVAVRATAERRVQLANHDPRYPPCNFACAPASAVDIDNTTHNWANYFKSGYKGALEALGCPDPVGMQCLVDGSVPGSAGLSGSSALVCCAVLAAMKANNRVLPQRDVVRVAVASERYIGTNGGGMDQTISIMARPQSAMFIEFDPALRVTPVRLPAADPPAVFVVANTLVVSDKAVTAPVRYNLRVVETRVGALLLARHLGVAAHPACAAADPLTFKTAMDARFAGQDAGGRAEVQVWIERLEAMLGAVQQAFGARPDGYTWAELAAALDVAPDELSARVRADRFPVRAARFRVLQRAQHAFSEALRVVRFRQLCEDARADGSGNGGGGGRLAALGALMNESQASCRDLFECSCAELDELCAIARRAGSLGSRLTGAGWGGCTVHLVPQDRAAGFISALRRDFYAKHAPGLSEEALSNAVFVTAPGTGAAFYAF